MRSTTALANSGFSFEKLARVFAEQKPAKDGCVHKHKRDLCYAQISLLYSVQGCTL